MMRMRGMQSAGETKPTELLRAQLKLDQIFRLKDALSLLESDDRFEVRSFNEKMNLIRNPRKIINKIRRRSE